MFVCVCVILFLYTNCFFGTWKLDECTLWGKKLHHFCNNFVKSFFLSAGCLTNCHSEVATTRQYLAQNFNRFARIALPWYCNLLQKVGNVRKSQVRCYNWSLASRDKAARWLCVHDALARCTWVTSETNPSRICDKISLLISQSAMATMATAVHHMFYRSRMYNEIYALRWLSLWPGWLMTSAEIN